MTVRIGLVTTGHQIDAVCRLRHQVLVEEDGYLTPRPGRRIRDRFDGTPGSFSVTAHVGDNLVGSVRITHRGARGSAADDYFDFSPYLKNSQRVGSANHLVVRKAYRTKPNLTFSMVATGYAEAEKSGMTHLIGSANPLTAGRFVESGWRSLCDPFWSKSHGLWVQPIMLELRQLAPRFRHFIKGRTSRQACYLQRPTWNSHQAIPT